METDRRMGFYFEQETDEDTLQPPIPNIPAYMQQATLKFNNFSRQQQHQ